MKAFAHKQMTRLHRAVARWFDEGATVFIRFSMCALIGIFAKSMALADGNIRRTSTDAEAQAMKMLASIGCKPGLNLATKRYAVIGVYKCCIETGTPQEEVYRIRNKGLRCALLDAKGRIAMYLAGHETTEKHLNESEDGYTMRLAYKAMAEKRLSRCREFPFAESWDPSSRIYTVAIPVVYNKRSVVGKQASEELSDNDRRYLEMTVKCLPLCRRAGCFRVSREDGTEYAVAFGYANIDGLEGRALKRKMLAARIEALGNMAFWLKSDISVTRIAGEFVKVKGDATTSWSEFCNAVSAECKYNGMPVNEVGFGETRNLITRSKEYWWACGVKLARENSESDDGVDLSELIGNVGAGGDPAKPVKNGPLRASARSEI